jgi:hypothetical protein
MDAALLVAGDLSRLHSRRWGETFHPKQMFAAFAEGNLIVGLKNCFLNPHLVYVRTVGGLAVAKHDLSGFVQAQPSVLAGDLVIRKDNLAFVLIAADGKTFGGNTERTAGKEPRCAE